MSRTRILVILVAVLAAGWVLSRGSGDRGEVQGTADRILVEKGARRLMLLRDGTALRSYRVALGGQPVGRKEQQGDEKTPEGSYAVTHHASPKFGKALYVSYPNADDSRRAAERGGLPGGEILIHRPAEGFRWLGPLHRLRDWTNGCIAVTSGEMDEILGMVPDGTPIEIVP